MAYEKFTIYRGCAQIKNLHCFNKAAADVRGIAVWYLNTYIEIVWDTFWTSKDR